MKLFELFDEDKLVRKWLSDHGIWDKEYVIENGKVNVKGGVHLVDRKIINLPVHFGVVGGSFNIKNNLITQDDLKSFPSRIGSHLQISYNDNLTSLKDIHRYVKQIGESIQIKGTPIKSHILGVIMIEDLKSINTDGPETDFGKACVIVNKHLGQGKAGVIKAQEELIEAGLDDFAEL